MSELKQTALVLVLSGWTLALCISGLMGNELTDVILGTLCLITGFLTLGSAIVLIMVIIQGD